MKKLLSLLLAFLLLFSIGCQKSDVRKAVEGTFYQNGIIVQNSAVTMTVHTDGIEVPVHQLDFTIHNHTGYDLVYAREKRIVERYRGGGWQVMYNLGAPSYTGQIPSEIETPVLQSQESTTHAIYFAESFAEIFDTQELIYTRTYLPLEPDTYRIRLPGCQLQKATGEAIGQNFEVIGYFTIYP